MVRKNQHVTPHPKGGWQVKGDNNSKATVRTKTQKEAADKARAIAIDLIDSILQIRQSQAGKWAVEDRLQLTDAFLDVVLRTAREYSFLIPLIFVFIPEIDNIAESGLLGHFVPLPADSCVIVYKPVYKPVKAF